MVPQDLHAPEHQDAMFSRRRSACSAFRRLDLFSVSNRTDLRSILLKLITVVYKSEHGRHSMWAFFHFARHRHWEGASLWRVSLWVWAFPQFKTFIFRSETPRTLQSATIHINQISKYPHRSNCFSLGFISSMMPQVLSRREKQPNSKYRFSVTR